MIVLSRKLYFVQVLTEAFYPVTSQTKSEAKKSIVGRFNFVQTNRIAAAFFDKDLHLCYNVVRCLRPPSRPFLYSVNLMRPIVNEMYPVLYSDQP